MLRTLDFELLVNLTPMSWHAPSIARLWRRGETSGAKSRSPKISQKRRHCLSWPGNGALAYGAPQSKPSHSPMRISRARWLHSSCVPCMIRSVACARSGAYSNREGHSCSSNMCAQGKVAAWVQDALVPLSTRCMSNCHWNRDTLHTVLQTGFQATQVRQLGGGLQPMLSLSAILPQTQEESEEGQ